MIDKISKIIIGIRYAKTFRIPDIDGQISDDILYGDKTPFGPEYFPETSETMSGDRLLFNKDSNNFLRINTDDLIMSLETDGNFNGAFDRLTSIFLPFIQDKVFQKYNIQNINRVGIIFSHKLNPIPKLNLAVTDFSQNKVTSPTGVRLYFSEKLSVAEGQYKKGVSDYRNTIYSLSQDDKKLSADLDYQHIFIPGIQDIRDAAPDRIVKEAKNFLTNIFHAWLKEYVQE